MKFQSGILMRGQGLVIGSGKINFFELGPQPIEVGEKAEDDDKQVQKPLVLKIADKFVLEMN